MTSVTAPGRYPVVYWPWIGEIPDDPAGQLRHTKDSRIGVARASLATLFAPAPARAA